MGNFDDDRSRRRKALGRGLGALIPRQEEEGGEKKNRFILLPVERVHAAHGQPRRNFDEDRIAELAESISESGLIQPLVVREKQGRYELIAGERRLRACKKAGIAEVPVVIKDVTDTEAFTLALIENIQREDLNPVEEALAYKRLLEETGATQADLARMVGKSRSALANSVRLLELSEEILEFLATGELTAGHARALIPLSPEEALTLAEKIIAGSWSVRETEEAVRRIKEGHPVEETRKVNSRYRDDALVRDLTDRLQHSLGTKVRLKDRDGKGKIEIFYDDIDILQSVLDKILEES